MRKIQVDHITYFITAHSWRILESLETDPLVVETHLVKDTFKSFFEGDTYRDLAKDTSMEIAVLCAHGHYADGVWVYNDGTKTHRVDDWVRRYDGEYAALLLLVCNGESTRLQPARHSLLVVPEGDIYFDIDIIVTPEGIYHFPEDDNKFRGASLQNYPGPFYTNHPEFIVLTPRSTS
ncbi:hypothetical protein IIB50_02980 [Patescibacteria group bacterium]|nr:hypothetical protein [Patescibacteria group bacterium]